MALRWLVALMACALGAPLASQAASCEWAQRYAADIVDTAAKAKASEDDLQARRLAREARPLAVDAAKEATLCNCPAAIPSLEDAALHASYADRGGNLTAIHQYAVRVKASGEKALDALRRCAPS